MLEKKAQAAARSDAEKEARETLAQLEMLDSQRESLVQELKEAKVDIIQVNPPSENPGDLKSVATLPEKPEEEIKTLVEVANAVINSKVEIDLDIKENLEETILENIREVIEENPQEIHLVSDEEQISRQLDNWENEGDKVQEFLKDNDIMNSDDPFSEFLKRQM